MNHRTTHRAARERRDAPLPPRVLLFTPLLLAALVLVGQTPSSAQGSRSIPVEGEECVPYQKSQSGDWHTEQALHAMAKRAMDEHTCAALQSRFLDIQRHAAGREEQFVERILSVMRNAQISGVKTSGEGQSEDRKQWCARLSFNLLAVPCGKIDPDFKTEVKISKPYVQAGENVVITASATRDSWLYVLSVEGDRAVMLAPSGYVTGENAHFRKAEEKLVLGEKGSGTGTMRAELAEGVGESKEYIKVIALRENIPFLSGDKAEYPMDEVLRRLFAISPDKWTYATTHYTIYK